MKKALVTGITGMVGSHLADFLLENTDWDVYGVCRWRSPLDNVTHLFFLFLFQQIPLKHLTVYALKKY